MRRAARSLMVTLPVMNCLRNPFRGRRFKDLNYPQAAAAGDLHGRATFLPLATRAGGQS
jgi:hypothetical protein